MLEDAVGGLLQHPPRSPCWRKGRASAAARALLGDRGRLTDLSFTRSSPVPFPGCDGSSRGTGMIWAPYPTSSSRPVSSRMGIL